MQRPVFAANWKMHLGPTEARVFMETFAARCTPRDDRTLIFFPPAISLTTVVASVGARPDLTVGVQNIWTEDKGAFTGETSAPMAREAGARYVLVGHSERRHIFGETDAETAGKCAAAVRSGLTPILCIGELLPERDAGLTTEVVLRQLAAGIAALDVDSVRDMAIAYEPVWAIGTGKTATPNDAADVHHAIRDALQQVVGSDSASIPILYGGSANRSNAAALLAASDVDGLLVGGASLDAEGWAAICDT